MTVDEALKWVGDKKYPAQIVEQTLAKALKKALAKIYELECEAMGNEYTGEMVFDREEKIKALELRIRKLTGDQTSSLS